MSIWTDLCAAWSVLHGAMSLGLTTDPALEAKFTLINERVPDVTISVVAKAPISKPEPITLKASVNVTIWRF